MVGANGISALISFLRTLVIQVAAILVLLIIWGLNEIWLSVVAKDISPYCIAVGNPCNVIKKRFDDELIGIMEKLKWWDKSVKEINDLIPLLTSSDLEKVKEELLKKI